MVDLEAQKGHTMYSIAFLGLALSPLSGTVLVVSSLMALGALIWAHIIRRRARRDRVLYEENPEPVLLTDTRWKITDANQAACDLFGYKKDQIKARTLNKIVETKTELDPALLKETVEAGKVLTFEATVVHDESDPIDLAATTRRVRLSGEHYLLTAFHEITRQKDEQRLFKAFHRRLVEDLPIEVVVTTPQGQYLYANPKSIPDKDLRDYLIGESDVVYCQELGLHPEVALRRRSHRRRAVSTKSTISFEEVLPAKDDTVRTLTRIFTPVLDRKGNVSAVVMYGVDLTELKRYQDQMAEVKAEAERLADLKEAFLANISHEFRTPLTGILGFAQLLQEDVESEEREFVDIILRNGRRLMATLNSMVDLSKLHSNYLEMNPEVFNLVDEVKQVAQSLSTLAQEKELYLRLRATRPEVLVRLDRSSLYRVLEHLIGNAIKFTHTGGVIVEVHGDQESVHVRVMDTGIGIRNEFLPFLFEEFNQESSGLSRNYEGTGIGLSVVKRMLDLMEGRINVDSEKGEGSMFTLTFPAAFPRMPGGARSRVLVADESEEVHTFVEYVLAPYFDVEYAKDFASIVRRAQETQYAVVLLDPEFDDAPSAAEALSPIRDLNGYEKVPVVALDPHPVHGGEVQFLAVGYDDCLQKPLDKRLLLESMGQLLANNRKRRKRMALNL
ncbi:MAG: ATP-binding protein [Rhodothermales bacterium]